MWQLRDGVVAVLVSERRMRPGRLSLHRSAVWLVSAWRARRLLATTQVAGGKCCVTVFCCCKTAAMASSHELALHLEVRLFVCAVCGF